MKILLVSMNSIHFRRWTEQLRDSGYEVHWFNIRSGAVDEHLDFVNQHTDWRYRIKKGRSWIKKIPVLNKWNERNVTHAFKKVLERIQPDVVHSFALYVSCTPILQVMQQNTRIPWVYSSWGSDLYFYRNDPDYLKDIKTTLPRLNYMFADCERDQQIATDLGFTGTHLGVFPGGGGFDLARFNQLRKPLKDRKIIAVKGNENRSGRALNVLKALANLSVDLQEYEVVVFGAQNKVILDIDKSLIPNLTINGLMPHNEIISLLCSSLIYIGNSNSDGMPNTMLEAICAGAFPIQSNPGNATQELIVNGENGYLINNADDCDEIEKVIKLSLENQEHLHLAVERNDQNIKPLLVRDLIQEKVLKAYSLINP